MLPQSKELDKRNEPSPAFYVCRAVMRDNLTVICLSLRVAITSYLPQGETHSYRDLHGRGTTFEIALFDLSAALVKVIEENDVIDTEDIPILVEPKTDKEMKSHGNNESVRTDEPDPAPGLVNDTHEDAGKGMETRGHNSSGSGSNKSGDRGTKRKARSANSSGGRSKRSG